MTDPARRRNVQIEWDLAQESLHEAEVMVSSRLWRGACSRGYYAAFHAARALLFSRGLQGKTHEGVRYLFNEHFLRTGRLPLTLSRVLARMESTREEADYEASAIVTREDAITQVEQARALQAAVQELLQADGYLGSEPS
ncbi:MAG: HEPN domain-containing protein [Candidatus Xenobia bacterium]